MLTTMFYYGYYKPYIIREVAKPHPASFRHIVKRPAPEQLKDAAYLMNKSRKTDIVQYAKGIYQSVTTVKDRARDVSTAMESFSQDVHKNGYEPTQAQIARTLSQFASAYNEATAFLLSQTHSSPLKNYGNTLSLNVEYNQNSLQNTGLQLTEDGTLTFDQDVLASYDQAKAKKVIGQNVSLFQNIYNTATDVLRVPLSEHMNFKNLNYYYNYKFGSLKADTFKLIETGMLVDRAV